MGRMNTYEPSVVYWLHVTLTSMDHNTLMMTLLSNRYPLHRDSQSQAQNSEPATAEQPLPTSSRQPITGSEPATAQQLPLIAGASPTSSQQPIRGELAVTDLQPEPMRLRAGPITAHTGGMAPGTCDDSSQSQSSISR